MRIGVVMVALELCLAARAPAQLSLVSQSLDSASVVRLHLARGGSVHAVLLTTFTPESDAVTYRPVHGDCGIPRAVCQIRTPVSEVRAIDVTHGYRAGRGALIGGVIGGMLGLIVRPGDAEFAAPCPPSAPGIAGGCGQHRSPSVLLTTAAGAALGAAVGAIFGLGSPSWAPAP